MVKKTCIDCKKDFEPVDGRQRRCPACRKAFLQSNPVPEKVEDKPSKQSKHGTAIEKSRKWAEDDPRPEADIRPIHNEDLQNFVADGRKLKLQEFNITGCAAKGFDITITTRIDDIRGLEEFMVVLNRFANIGIPLKETSVIGMPDKEPVKEQGAS